MWIHTQYGFFSITRTLATRRTDAWYGKMQVRARLRADLEALIGAAQLQRPKVPDCPLVRDIIVGGGTDYQYRIIVDPSTAAGIMLMLVATIDYTNFKARIAQTPSQRAKLHDLHNIWSMTLGWQMDEPAKGRCPHCHFGAGQHASDCSPIPRPAGGQHTNSSPMQGTLRRPAKKGGQP